MSDSRHFCTYFDHNYLPRGLVLYDSLQKHCPGSILHVLALSPECEDILNKLGLPGIKVYPLSELEEADTELSASKDTRSKVEYYFTITPCWTRYVFLQNPNISLLSYTDADMVFLSNPESIFSKMTDISAGLIGHRFPERLKHLEELGKYNVGFMPFKNDAEGMKVLEWWRKSCIEWCYDRLEGERYADQKYLDKFPEISAAAKELPHKGINVAPWNLDTFTFSLKEGYVFADDDPLVCFHFHGLKNICGPLWNTAQSAHYKNSPNEILKRNVYAPYINELAAREKELAPLIRIANVVLRKPDKPLASRMVAFIKFMIKAVRFKDLYCSW